MNIINVYEAKTTLSQLISRTLNGEEIVIAKFGKPLVRLTPYVKTVKARVGGQLKGKIKIKKDFDKLPRDFMTHFQP